jgi:hypothetical protein
LLISFVKTSVTNARKRCFIDEVKRLSQSVAGLFDSAISNNGNLDRLITEHNRYLEAIGLNTEVNRSFYTTIKELAGALNAYSESSESDKCDLNEVLMRFMKIAEDFVKSQPGLEGIPEAVNLRADPRNDEYFTLYDAIKVNTALIGTNPTAASEIFNAQTAEIWSHFAILTVEVSKRAMEAKQ